MEKEISLIIKPKKEFLIDSFIGEKIADDNSLILKPSKNREDFANPIISFKIEENVMESLELLENLFKNIPKNKRINSLVNVYVPYTNIDLIYSETKEVYIEKTAMYDMGRHILVEDFFVENCEDLILNKIRDLYTNYTSKIEKFFLSVDFSEYRKPPAYLNIIYHTSRTNLEFFIPYSKDKDLLTSMNLLKEIGSEFLFDIPESTKIKGILVDNGLKRILDKFNKK